MSIRAMVSKCALWCGAAVVAGCLSPSAANAQSEVSAEGYVAKPVGASDNRHYVVKDRRGTLILTTSGKFPGNDVKAGAFDPRSTRFAAVYHYADGGNHSWIGVWSMQTRGCVQAFRVAGFTYDATLAFQENPSSQHRVVPAGCPGKN